MSNNHFPDAAGIPLGILLEMQSEIAVAIADRNADKPTPPAPTCCDPTAPTDEQVRGARAYITSKTVFAPWVAPHIDTILAALDQAQEKYRILLDTYTDAQCAHGTTLAQLEQAQGEVERLNSRVIEENRALRYKTEYAEEARADLSKAQKENARLVEELEGVRNSAALNDEMLRHELAETEFRLGKENSAQAAQIKRLREVAKETINGVSCLCAEGIEFMGKVDLTNAIMKDLAPLQEALKEASK